MTVNFKVCNACKRKAGACGSCLENPLESVGNNGGDNRMDIDKLISEAVGRPENEILNDKVYWERENALEAKKKRGSRTLTETEKIRLDEACEIEKDTINHSYDAAIEEAFGPGIQSTSRLKDLDDIL